MSSTASPQHGQNSELDVMIALEAIRGIQRGLDAMKEGTGKPYRVALDEIRAQYKISRRKK